MSKYKSIKSKMLIVVIIFVLGLTFYFAEYSHLEKEEVYINQQISKTLATERHLVAIEKQVYSDIVHEEDSSRLIKDKINILLTLYQDSYKKDILDIIENQDVINDYGDQIKKLILKQDDLIKFDFEAFTQSNDQVKNHLIQAIKAHSSSSSKILILMSISLAFLLSVVIYLAYKEIVRPLKIITDSINKQHQQLSMNEIIDIEVNNEINLLVHEYNQLVKQNNLILKLNEKIHAQHTFEEVFDFIYESLKVFIPYDRIGIAMITDDGKSIEALTAKSRYKVRLNRGYNQLLETSSLKHVIQNHEVRIINDLELYIKGHPFSESTKLILDEGMLSSITLPLFHDDRAIGVVFFSSREKFVYNEEHQLFLVNIANALSTSLEKSFIFEDLMISTVRGFAKMVESKDNITGNHIDRIGHYSTFISKLLEDEYPEIDDNFIKSIRRLSPLHDIGKVSIPDHILNKPGRLTDEEMAIMKTHSAHGAEVLEELLVSIGTEEFKMAVDIANYHHEKIDGSGYPEGLKGHDIPLSARIVALVDVFDALTSERPYKKAFTFDEAMNIIQKDAGKHFDQNIVDYLMNHLDDFKKLYERLWASSSF